MTLEAGIGDISPNSFRQHSASLDSLDKCSGIRLLIDWSLRKEKRCSKMLQI